MYQNAVQQVEKLVAIVSPRVQKIEAEKPQRIKHFIIGLGKVQPNIKE